MGRLILHILLATVASGAMALEGPDAARAGGGAAARPRREIKKLVIDPGHGGEERGAVGPSGLDEKTVTLELSEIVRDLLRKEPGITVALTREDDRPVGLWDRPAQANRMGADLFVSIHANSSRADEASGVETYFMSLNAPDEDARRLAAIENEATSAAIAPPEARDDVANILVSMAQEEYLEESQSLAETIQVELDRALRVPNRGIKQAPFVVLRNATMPAVLVEVGFISNPAIERKLADPAYLGQIASAIVRGIDAFRKTYER